MKSPIQFVHRPDGSIELDGCPNVTLQTIEQQGKVRGRDWQRELRLPKYEEEWQALSVVRGLSQRHVRFVLIDESPSRLPGHPRATPSQWVLPPQGCPFELGHTGFVIGLMSAFVLGFGPDRREVPACLGIDLPCDFNPEGDFILGQAVLFDSDLANIAWTGLEKEIFSHVCPVTFRQAAPPHVETLVQVTLTPGDYPGCSNARVIAIWES